MNEMLAVSNDMVRMVAWTLLHFFWQGALVAVALAAALTLARRGSSHLRYSIACGALVMMAALPVTTGWWLSSLDPVSDGPRAVGPAAAVAGAGATGSVPVPEAMADGGRQAAPGAASSVLSASAARPVTLLDPTLPWVVALWLVGVAGLSLVHLGGWLRVRRLRYQGTRQVEPHWRRSCERLANRLGIRRSVELLASARVAVPTVIGWLRPVVLFPASTFTGLDPRQLESILAHELAHVRRHDYLVNVLQVVMETLLFYHPAVWWASRQVRELREHCCDDLAVAVCGDRMIYARALADLEELRFVTPPVTSNMLALGADGGSLLERIRRLAGARSTPAEAPAWMATAVATATLVATVAVLAIAGRPSLAQETGAVDPMEIGIRNPTLLPPVIIAQVTEEQGGTDAPPVRDQRPSAGATSLPIPLDDLIEMKMHGLDDLLDEVEGTAYADLPTRELLEMARFGVDSELIAELDAAGYRELPAAELVELAKFGVDGELIAVLQAAGLGTPTAVALVELAKFGVDGDYIQEMRAAGYEASIEGLVELAKFGVDGELIRELGEAGFSDLSAGELVELARFGVDDDYVQEMRAAGYEVTSIPELVELAKFGVDGELISELAELGYPDLAVEDIVELAKFGVDGDFIRELRDAGFDNFSVDDLTRMARHGIDAEFLSKMNERDRI